MKDQGFHVFGLILLLFLAACTGQAPTPTTIPAEATPAVQAPTLEPPTATATDAPPTATPKPPTATATLVSLTPTAEPPSATPSPETSGKGKIEEGQITSQALAGNIIGDPNTRDYLVYLPPNYHSSDKLYPVVYALHAFNDDEWGMIRLATDMNELLAGDEVQEMILVFVNGDNRLGGSFYLSSPTIGDYESYVAQEMVKLIDASYRTLPVAESRGIVGCSMGGTGALHLAFKYPKVFGIAAPVSGLYNFEHDSTWEVVKEHYWRKPESFEDYASINSDAKLLIALAAAAAPNPDRPPFYLDMPFEEVDGEVQIVPEVWEKVNGASVVQDVGPYLEQPVRLQGLLLYHGTRDAVEPVRDFSQLLDEHGIQHEYLEVRGGHCNLDYVPVLRFMSDNLQFAE